MIKRAYWVKKILRENSPWWLVNTGIFGKGKDCARKGAEHDWYKIDQHHLGCYYCKVIKKINDNENDAQ